MHLTNYQVHVKTNQQRAGELDQSDKEGTVQVRGSKSQGSAVYFLAEG